MPAMRLALTAPMWSASSGGQEKEGIPAVMQLMNDYCLTKDDHIALLEMTRIKVLPPAKLSTFAYMSRRRRGFPPPFEIRRV